MKTRYCIHGFETCARCNPPKPYIWTPATPQETAAYAVRCEKRKTWLTEQLKTRPDAWPATRKAWRDYSTVTI